VSNSLPEIVERIAQANIDHKPVMIAVEGFGGSGKSTFAEKLRQGLGNAYVISIDDFIVKSKITEPSWDEGGFDRERLEKQVLLPIRAGKPASFQKLIWETDTLSEPMTIPQTDYLIIEGISSYHPNLEKYYDYKIWIDTPMEIAKKRGHARDGSNENAIHWDLWAANDLAYQEHYHPEQRADFTYDNGKI
jgi:uridine kinase